MEELIHRSKKQMKDMNLTVYKYFIVEDFYDIENLGIECSPRCGGCKCGKCSLGSKNYTIKEEKELALIEKNLHYDQEAKRWIAEYPWIRDPKDLPDNKKAAFAKLISTERRLAKKFRTCKSL